MSFFCAQCGKETNGFEDKENPVGTMAFCSKECRDVAAAAELLACYGEPFEEPWNVAVDGKPIEHVYNMQITMRARSMSLREIAEVSFDCFDDNLLFQNPIKAKVWLIRLRPGDDPRVLHVTRYDVEWNREDRMGFMGTSREYLPPYNLPPRRVRIDGFVELGT